MGSCTVYKNQDAYKIVTESLNTLGMGISTFPIHILPINSNVEELKNSIQNCINASEEEVDLSPDTEAFTKLSKGLLIELQEKSYTNLYKSSRGCSIEETESGYTLTLYKLYAPKKPQHGFVGDKTFNFENIEQVIESLMML